LFFGWLRFFSRPGSTPTDWAEHDVGIGLIYWGGCGLSPVVRGGHWAAQRACGGS